MSGWDTLGGFSPASGDLVLQAIAVRASGRALGAGGAGKWAFDTCLKFRSAAVSVSAYDEIVELVNDLQRQD